MDITIKDMKTDDEIKGKAYVHYKCWHDSYKGIIDDAYLDTMTLQKCEDTAFKWRDNLIVAKDGDRVIGFSGYGNCEDDDLHDAGEVFAIYVLSEYHGTGVGQLLMNEAVSRLGDHSRIVVHVLKENGRAISFYKKLGFLPDGTEQELTFGSPVVVIRMILDK